MFWTLLFGSFIALLIWDYFNKKHRVEVLQKSKIAGPTRIPILGNPQLARGMTAETAVEKFRQMILENNKIFSSWMLHQLTVFSSDAKDLEVLLQSQVHITKNNVYDMLSLWLGDGLLMSTGKKWHARRKIITPTFHFKILEQFVEIFDKQSSVMIEQLKPKADGATIVDIMPFVCSTALDIITESAMGVQVHAQSNPDFGYVQSVKIVTELIADRLRQPLYRADWLYRLVAPQQYKKLIENIRLMKNFTHGVIETRRKLLQQNQTNIEPQEDEVGAKRRMALLDVLLQATVDGKPLSNEDIREEVETFMFEGHDTTTSGISFTLYLISRYPAVQQKIFEEIRQVIGDDAQASVGLRELNELKYLECVIKESLRLYPPVPIIGRYFAEDVEINNRIIPARTHFNMALYVVLRDADYFEDANSFKPERFLNNDVGNILPFAYVPFSAGPRNCIGQKFAMYEMKSTLTKVLRNFELLPLGEDVIPTLSLVMRSKNGMNMGLKLRKYD